MKDYEKMIELGMDGIVFYPILDCPYDKDCRIHCDYTVEEYKNVKGTPRSNWAYYKGSGTSKDFYDDKGHLIHPRIKASEVPKKNFALEVLAMMIVNKINETNEVSVKQCQKTNDELMDYVYGQLIELQNRKVRN